MSIFFFIIGLFIGSFLNVVIDRIPKGKSIVRGRSHCDFCQKTLSWCELIPLFSFFILKGKCSQCHKKLSWQYPIVEFATGFLFLFTFLSISSFLSSGYTEWVLLYLLFIFTSLLALFVTDLKYRVLPDPIIAGLIFVSLGFQFFFVPHLLLNHFLSGIISFLFFFFLFVVTGGRGMGLGDVKFAFFMGLFLGFPRILVALYLAFLTGAAVSLILIGGGKKTMKSTIAFGPFLVCATFLSLFFGSTLWMWLQRILGI